MPCNQEPYGRLSSLPTQPAAQEQPIRPAIRGSKARPIAGVEAVQLPIEFKVRDGQSTASQNECMHKSVWLSGAILVLSGCGTFKVQDYVSAQVSGRVLDTSTRQPIENVTVRRIPWNAGQESEIPSKGGAMLLNQDAVRTREDGTFKLSATKDVLTFSSGGSYGARLMLQHSGYETLRTNFPGTGVIWENPKQPPKLDAGDIYLRPRSD